jgi:hypothetical protein
MILKKSTLPMLLAWVTACTTPGEPEKRSQQSYFPLDAGQYSEFRIEKTIYAQHKAEEKILIQARKRILAPFSREDGQVIYPIEYTSRINQAFSETDSVTAAWQTLNRIFEQEGGKPVVKLTLPVYDHAYWNGNAFNAGKARQYRTVQVSKPYLVGQMLYPNTITIVIQDDSTLLSRKKYIETYAADVGLIRRERIDLQYCYTVDCVGRGIIYSGWKEIMTIQNFGKQ